MRGYVALTVILVIIPVLLLTGVDSMYKSISMLIVGKMKYDYQILRTNTETCIEESVYRLKRNPSFTGDINLSNSSWSCTISVIDKSGHPNIKVLTIVTHDSFNDVKSTVKKELDTNPNPFELHNIE
jgi:hypothetical protein